MRDGVSVLPHTAQRQRQAMKCRNPGMKCRIAGWPGSGIAVGRWQVPPLFNPILTELGDFRFVLLRPAGARQVAGFGAARSVDAGEIRRALTA